MIVFLKVVWNSHVYIIITLDVKYLHARFIHKLFINTEAYCLDFVCKSIFCQLFGSSCISSESGADCKYGIFSSSSINQSRGHTPAALQQAIYSLPSDLNSWFYLYWSANLYIFKKFVYFFVSHCHTTKSPVK